MADDTASSTGYFSDVLFGLGDLTKSAGDAYNSVVTANANAKAQAAASYDPSRYGGPIQLDQPAYTGKAVSSTLVVVGVVVAAALVGVLVLRAVK